MSPARQQIYSRYERLWHWAQAAGILMLVLTGLVIHAPSTVSIMSFHAAVSIHNVLGWLLVVNAALGLFYYLTSGAIRQYLPEPREFTSLAIRQAAFYVRGIFCGEAHPLERTPQRRLNPLQQVTYLIILNVLLPLQLATGLLMWSGQRWPGAVSAVGGLAGLAPIHTLGAWLFGAFLVAHLYLTTTGTTPLANLRAMIWGYEETRTGATARSNASAEELVP
jgi:thiosulfate reductase cytochrome b subunit